MESHAAYDLLVSTKWASASTARCWHNPLKWCGNLGRGDRIRTCDPHTPSVMRYQAALRPDRGWGTYARGARDASAVARGGATARRSRTAGLAPSDSTPRHFRHDRCTDHHCPLPKGRSMPPLNQPIMPFSTRKTICTYTFDSVDHIAVPTVYGLHSPCIGKYRCRPSPYTVAQISGEGLTNVGSQKSRCICSFISIFDIPSCKIRYTSCTSSIIASLTCDRQNRNIKAPIAPSHKSARISSREHQPPRSTDFERGGLRPGHPRSTASPPSTAPGAVQPNVARPLDK